MNKQFFKAALLAALAWLTCMLVGCATVDPAISVDVEKRRVVATGMLKLATEIHRAGGTIESMWRGNDSGNFHISVPAAQSAAVASILQSSDILGLGGLQQKPDPESGPTRIIVGAAFSSQFPRGQQVSPVASAEWDKAPLDFANSSALQRNLYFERFYPVATERLAATLTRTRLQVIVTGTADALAAWVAHMHSGADSALLMDNIKLEKYEGRRYDRRPYKLSGDLYVYRRE